MTFAITSLASDTWTADDAARWAQAGVYLRGALFCAEAATAVLTPLPAETQWSSEGLRALHEALLDFRERAASVLSALRQRVHEWETEVPA